MEMNADRRVLKWKMLNRVRLVATPWTLQSVEFSRPGCCSGQPFPSPGDPPNPGIKPRSPTLQVDALPAEPQGSPRILEWVAYPFSSASPWPRNWARISCLAGGFFTNWAVREAQRVLRWVQETSYLGAQYFICNRNFLYKTKVICDTRSHQRLE